MKLTGKHLVEEINGIRCSIIEKEATQERMAFLQKLLEHNGYTVMIEKNQAAIPPQPNPETAEPPARFPETWKTGVTDITFMLPVALYGRMLKTVEGKLVSPPYWSQEQPGWKGWYWKFKNR